MKLAYGMVKSGVIAERTPLGELLMNVYQELGLKPIINASGTVTRLGGAPMPAEVLDAFRNAASKWVPLDQLQAAASLRIAAHTGTEAGLVTSGSAGALTLGAAAILAGHDLGRMEQLPHCDSFPHEMIIAREHRSGYDHAVRAAGVRLVEVGFNEIVSNAGVRRTEAWEYEAAISPATAGIVYVYSNDAPLPLEAVAGVAHRHSLPVLVDAAGELPPRSNLKDIAAQGADLVAFSGGKAIRGPQSTGILCGRADLISSAALQMLDMDDHFELWEAPGEFIQHEKLPGLPRHGIGRALKVSKEEIIALLTALELFASGAYDAELPKYRSYLEAIANELEASPATARIVESSSQERWPVLEVHLDESSGKTAVEACRELRRGTPPIYVSHGRLSEGILVINPVCLDESSAKVLGERLCALLGSQ